MAMGRRRKRIRQEQLWTPTDALPVSAGHPFYQKLNQLLDERHFDEVVERMCERFYAERMGRPGLAPGIYFRLLMVGYFEASIRSVASPGAPATVCRSVRLCGSRWMKPFQTTRRSLERDD